MSTDVEDLAPLVARGAVVVLSGAGISTESGIPDYCGPSGASPRRHAPMTYQSFAGDAVARRRTGRAGAERVIDLHGRLDRVVCLSCGAATPRSVARARLETANAVWRATVTAVNPDGDVDLPDEQLDGFTVVDCDRCGGLLKLESPLGETLTHVVHHLVDLRSVPYRMSQASAAAATCRTSVPQHPPMTRSSGSRPRRLR